MAWRNAYALDTLLSAVNAINPNRSKASDGTIGDAAHASRSSDHNPWVKVGSMGIVRARDITRAGLDLPAIFEQLRRLGAAGDPRLNGGGYLILDRRITTPTFSGWKTYTGSNPHTKHGHVSLSRNQAGFDSRTPWNLRGGTPTPAAPASSGRRVLRRGATGTDVRDLQTVLARWYPQLRVAIDGVFGPGTEKAVRELQGRAGLVIDGIAGPATFRVLGMA